MLMNDFLAVSLNKIKDQNEASYYIYPSWIFSSALISKCYLWTCLSPMNIVDIQNKYIAGTGLLIILRNISDNIVWNYVSQNITNTLI